MGKIDGELSVFEIKGVASLASIPLIILQNQIFRNHSKRNKNHGSEKIKKCLFGKPAPKVVDDFLKEGLKKMKEEKIKQAIKRYGDPRQVTVGSKRSSTATKASDFFEILESTIILRRL